MQIGPCVDAQRASKQKIQRADLSVPESPKDLLDGDYSLTCRGRRRADDRLHRNPVC